jgi:hypothetical protein
MPQCHRSGRPAKLDSTSRVVGIWGRCEQVQVMFFRSIVFGLVAFDLGFRTGQMGLYTDRTSMLLTGRAHP